MAFPIIDVSASLVVGPQASPVWSCLAADNYEVHIRRGRQHVLDRIEAGTMTARLDNVSRDYDPLYAAGPFYGNLLPMRRIRVRGCYGVSTTSTIVGSGAIDRSSAGMALFTLIDIHAPVTSDGLITSVSIWAATNLGGCKVATFYQNTPDFFSTRDTATIGTVTAGSKQTFPVSLVCCAGDYLGIYFTSGTIDYEWPLAGYGLYMVGADCIPCSNTEFLYDGGYAISLEGTTGAFISMGAGATNRASTVSALYTHIDAGNPATVAGMITSVSIWANTNMTGCKVATFYKATPGSNILSTRDAAYIGAVTAGSAQSFDVRLCCEKGDYIGIYSATGILEADVAGGSGRWVRVGNYIPGSATAFTWVAGAALSIAATGYTGTVEDVFHGYIEKWPMSWDNGIEPIVTIEAADGMTVLAKGKLNATYASEKTNVRISNVLDAVSWTVGAAWVLDSVTNSQLGTTTILGPVNDRFLSQAQTTLQASTLADETALQHIQDAVQAENGLWFIGRDGAVYFYGRHDKYRPDYIADTTEFGDAIGELRYVDLAFSYDDDDIYNDVRMTRTGGTAQTASDTASQLAYFVRTLSQDNLLANSDSEMSDRANWLLARHKDPQSRIREMELEGAQDELWAAMLGVEIGDRIRVTRRPTVGAAIIEDYHVEGVQHDIAKRRWRMRLALSAADPRLYWLVCGSAGDEFSASAVLGTTTILAY